MNAAMEKIEQKWTACNFLGWNKLARHDKPTNQMMAFIFRVGAKKYYGIENTAASASTRPRNVMAWKMEVMTLYHTIIMVSYDYYGKIFI